MHIAIVVIATAAIMYMICMSLFWILAFIFGNETTNDLGFTLLFVVVVSAFIGYATYEIDYSYLGRNIDYFYHVLFFLLVIFGLIVRGRRAR